MTIYPNAVGSEEQDIAVRMWAHEPMGIYARRTDRADLGSESDL